MLVLKGAKTDKSASILNYIETNMVKKGCYLIRQDNTIHTCCIKLSFSSLRQDKSKLQKQIRKLLILTEMAV